MLSSMGRTAAAEANEGTSMQTKQSVTILQIYYYLQTYKHYTFTIPLQR